MSSYLGLSSIDIAVFVIYVLIIIGVGLFVSRNKKGTPKLRKIIFSRVSLYRGGLLVHHLLLRIFQQNNLLVCQALVTRLDLRLRLMNGCLR